MYKVTTYEMWKGRLTEFNYEFSSIFEVLNFALMCQEDGIKYQVFKGKNKEMRKVS